jgi:ABC-2 type transport system permease protein
MPAQLLAIARNTFTESVRQPIYFIIIFLSGILQVFNTTLSHYSMEYSAETEVVKDDKILLDVGLATVLVACTLLAAFTATSVLSREIENRTALTVVSKPVGRPLFVLGKYLGVAAALMMAAVIMLTFFYFALRHGVMSTVRDPYHGPVLTFSIGATLLAIGIAIWTNFFYGWVFPSTASFALLCLLPPAYLAALPLDPGWALQPFLADVKPQVLLASAAVLPSILVLTAVAITASTRLGQVMTIVISAAVFVAGLLSNYLIGRFAYQNTHIARVESVEIPLDEPTLTDAGDSVTIVLDAIPRSDFDPGDPVYYGPNPSGIALAVPNQEPFRGDPTNIADVAGPEAPDALVVRDADDETRTYTIVNSGGLNVARLPREGDYVFVTPTAINPAAIAVWSAIPNLQSFWLIDAVTQGHDIPPRYLYLVYAYGAVQITGLLGLAVFLFQKREVG